MQQRADWTVMIFMNGDNNLEPAALQNFRQMAEVNYSERVNVLLQFDRINKYDKHPPWSGTLRFRMSHNVEPLPHSALADLGEKDMGNAATLRDFVTWAKTEYPAHRYMLLIWDHGQGWRLQMRAQAAESATTQSRADSPSARPEGRGATYRSISVDETNGHHRLYNRAIQESLKNQGLDLIGFDACLMSMIETAYAMRHVAKVMVASEEVVPADGWPYAQWLQGLMDHPQMDARELGALLVKSYGKAYTKSGTETLSAIDLSKIDSLAAAVSVLADVLASHLDDHLPEIIHARLSTFAYDPDDLWRGENMFQHIDLGRFASQVGTLIPEKDVAEAAKTVSRILEASTIKAYAGSERSGSYGSHGLAIYFPRSRKVYQADFLEEGAYQRNSGVLKWPVEFVQTQRWVDFLQAYFKRVP